MMQCLFKNNMLFFVLLFCSHISVFAGTEAALLQQKCEQMLQAIDQDNEQGVKLLLCDPFNAKKIFQYSISQQIPLLSQALKQNRLNIARILIALGSPLELYDAQKWTALHWAAVHNYDEIFKILKNKGANIFALDGDRLTPYDHACLLKHKNIFELYSEAEKHKNESISRDLLVQSFICADDGHLHFNGWKVSS